MKIIKYNQDESAINVQVDINGIELWKYTYFADEPFNNSERLKRTPKHELGISKQLEKDAHSWQIYLANPNDEDVSVNVSLKWFENENELDTWIPEEAGDDDKVVLKGNSGIEITDSSYFMKS
jgi:hypothetical protein